MSQEGLSAWPLSPNVSGLSLLNEGFSHEGRFSSRELVTACFSVVSSLHFVVPSVVKISCYRDLTRKEKSEHWSLRDYTI